MKIILMVVFSVLLGISLNDRMPRLYQSRPALVNTVALVTPTPTPSTTDVVLAITKEFAPEGKTIVKKMLDISFCESGWRWDAINIQNRNGSVDHGALQINSIHTKRYGNGFKTDLQENVRVAHEIFKASGVSPWVCSGNLGMK